MAGYLSTEQLLLLNNLMYMNNTSPLKNIKNLDVQDGCTIEEYINDIDVNAFQNNADYGTGTTAQEWKDIISAIKNDKQLMQMEIVAVHVDDAAGGGNGVSTVFADQTTKEAVVTFRGTSGGEWKDNFVGGGYTNTEDGVSTPQQENALEWYQSLELDQYDTITITGHSKGGNKAKYITTLDDSVDRCVSFDGQGFSDEFCEQYEQQIAANQYKISNHNVQEDYVNMLLNDIGETTYYKAYNIGKDGFIENHCPNTFLKFNEDGSWELVEGTRSEVITEVDEFLNNYLRTLEPEEKAEMLQLIGELVELGFNNASVEEILETFLESDNAKQASHLLAYILEYNINKPEFGEKLQTLLNNLGIDSRILDVVFKLAEWEHIDEVLVFLAGGILEFEWLITKLRDFLKEKANIDLSDEEIRLLLGLIQQIDDERNNIEIEDNGEDIVIKNTNRNTSGKCDLLIQSEIMLLVETNFADYSNRILTYAAKVNDISGKFTKFNAEIRTILGGLESKMHNDAQKCKQFGEILCESKNMYCVLEKRLANSI